jgi:hypothetical protein
VEDHERDLGDDVGFGVSVGSKIPHAAQETSTVVPSWNVHAPHPVKWKAVMIVTSPTTGRQSSVNPLDAC